ncbi:YgdI/YgdR family lipoprotein [Lacibacterium aquatile]|uniref:YgdI/YgdR family lipoprotein n=1 Tax=Lacibacterium aquatile TaxID=1168082 RepID=A0ABW5DVW3_9PROT
MALRAALILSSLLLAACGSSQYLISTQNGTMITAYSKPELDKKTGMMEYKDADGRRVSINKDQVVQIVER